MVRCAIRILLPSLRGTSGIATYTLSLAKGLASFGHEVVLLDETGEFGATDPRITVAPLRSPRHLPYPLEPIAEWELIGTVRRLADEYEVDGIHATRLGFAPKDRNLVITAWDPVVSPIGRLHAASWRGEPRAAEAMYAVVDAVAARRAGAIVTVTQAVRRAYGRFGRCAFVPPFLNDQAIMPAKPGRAHDVVMVAGALDMPRKGLEVALEAVSRVRHAVPDARLVLVGDWLESERRDSLPEFCEVRGQLGPDDVQATLAAAGCCCIPSLWEEFGYAGLEALAAGTPVACTPLPSYESLSGGGVFMAASRDPSQLAEAVIAALEANTFDFPAECRASAAVPRIVDLYRDSFGAG